MSHKYNKWVFEKEIEGEQAAPGVTRKVLAYCDEMMSVLNIFEKGAVGARHSHPHTQITYIIDGLFEFAIGSETKVVGKGDTLLKQNGIEHGCVCLEAGSMLDVFNPMRMDFVRE